MNTAQNKLSSGNRNTQWEDIIISDDDSRLFISKPILILNEIYLKNSKQFMKSQKMKEVLVQN